MRSKLLATSALTSSTAFAAGAALAADMPLKAPPMAPPFSWNGCYVGLNAGGASVNVGQQITIPGVISIDNGGRQGSFIGGGQVGCNWQFDPQWVVGIEGDVDYLNASRTGAFRFRFAGEDTTGAQSSRLRWLSTVRAKLGYAWGRTLLYGTGGLAVGNVDSSLAAVSRNANNGVFTAQFAGSLSETRVGWTAGVGLEHAFTDRVSAKLEYLHFDLGSPGYNVVRVAGASTSLPLVWNASTNFYGDIIRVGVNYKWN
jgi:outer membrane immunogenic protein